MPSLKTQVLADKARRDEAKLAFDARLAQVKLDLNARGIAGRVADEVSEQARVVIDEATDVAQEYPGVIGGTIVALVFWFIRNPVLAGLEKVFGTGR